MSECRRGHNFGPYFAITKDTYTGDQHTGTHRMHTRMRTRTVQIMWHSIMPCSRWRARLHNGSARSVPQHVYSQKSCASRVGLSNPVQTYTHIDINNAPQCIGGNCNCCLTYGRYIWYSPHMLHQFILRNNIKNQSGTTGNNAWTRPLLK